MEPNSQRGQILLECLFALSFLVIMITFIQKDWSKKHYKKTIEGMRIYDFRSYKKNY